jgi:hypothetical protein
MHGHAAGSAGAALTEGVSEINPFSSEGIKIRRLHKGMTGGTQTFRSEFIAAYPQYIQFLSVSHGGTL